MFEEQRTNYLEKFPECLRCKRHPSLAGRETMFLVPYGTMYYILCGGCMKKFMEINGCKTNLDLYNLFTHSPNYNGYFDQFLLKGVG